MQIVKHNSYIAVAFLAKLSNYPIIGDYLEAFITPPLTSNAIDAFSRIHKTIKIPHDMTLTFTLFAIKDIQHRPETDKDRNKLAKLTCQFIRTLLKNNVLDLKNYIDDFEEFINSFLNIEDVVSLKKLIQGQKD